MKMSDVGISVQSNFSEMPRLIFKFGMLMRYYLKDTIVDQRRKDGDCVINTIPIF